MSADDRFQVIVESVPNAIVMVDARSRIVLVNSQAEALFGRTRAELMEMTLEELVRGSGRPRQVLRRDGSETPIEIGTTAVTMDGQTLQLVTLVDVTERMRDHAALLRKTEEVEAFVYVVSHDLRTPLVNLKGFSRELDMSCRELTAQLQGTALPPDVSQVVHRILQDDIAVSLRYIAASAQKLERLLDALLSLSRTGRHEFDLVPIDVSGIVETTIDSLRQTIENRAAIVRHGPLPAARGDATAVGQVFSNLLTNALFYLDPDRPGRIEVGGANHNGYCQYWVSDNGVGIPAAARSRLFQIFQRLHPDLAPGEGMGLAIVKRVIERHGGRIWFDSIEGEGTTFYLTLPSEPTDV